MKNLNPVYDHIIASIQGRLDLFGIKKDELNGRFDLVKSGLMDSMTFVSFIGELEAHFGKEIDFDEVLDDKSLTTLDGIVKMFQP